MDSSGHPETSNLDSRQPTYRQFTEMVYGPGYSSFCKQTLRYCIRDTRLLQEVIHTEVRPNLCKNIYNISS